MTVKDDNVVRSRRVRGVRGVRGKRGVRGVRGVAQPGLRGSPKVAQLRRIAIGKINSHVDGVLDHIAVFLGGYGNKNWVRYSCFGGRRRHLEGVGHHRDGRTPRPEQSQIK